MPLLLRLKISSTPSQYQLKNVSKNNVAWVRIILINTLKASAHKQV